MGYAVDEEHIYLFTNYVHGGDLHQLLFKEVYSCVFMCCHVHIDNLIFRHPDTVGQPMTDC